MAIRRRIKEKKQMSRGMGVFSNGSLLPQNDNKMGLLRRGTLKISKKELMEEANEAYQRIDRDPHEVAFCQQERYLNPITRVKGQKASSAPMKKLWI